MDWSDLMPEMLGKTWVYRHFIVHFQDEDNAIKMLCLGIFHGNVPILHELRTPLEKLSRHFCDRFFRFTVPSRVMCVCYSHSCGNVASHYQTLQGPSPETITRWRTHKTYENLQEDEEYFRNSALNCTDRFRSNCISGYSGRGICLRQLQRRWGRVWWWSRSLNPCYRLARTSCLHTSVRTYTRTCMYILHVYIVHVYICTCKYTYV